jgi:hypothetical protein
MPARYRRQPKNPDGPLTHLTSSIFRRRGSSLEDTIAAGPGGSASESDKPKTRKPIGVPEGYQVAQTRDPESFRGMSPNAVDRWTLNGVGPGSTSVGGPRYFDGDEWRPANTSAQSVAALQRAMATAGLLDKFRYGVWDDQSAKAYAKVLGYANASGTTAQMALSRMVNNPQLSMAGGGGGSGSGSGGGAGGGVVGFDENGNPIYGGYVAPPLTLKTTNKDDLRKVMRSAVIDKMGQGWTQQQINELVDAYNWKEIQVQKDAYDQQVALERTAFEQGAGAVSGQTSVTTDVPSPETFVENELMRRDPTGYQAGQVVNEAIPTFMSLLDGWG